MYAVYLCSLFYSISNTGTCVDQINGYKCQCQPGYTGIDCDVDIDECQSSPCINGTCVNKVNGYNCVCQAGFNGTRCEKNINECLLNSMWKWNLC